MGQPEPKELIVPHPGNYLFGIMRERSAQERPYRSDYVFGARTYPEFIEKNVTLGLGYRDDYATPANSSLLDLKYHLGELELRNPSWGELQSNRVMHLMLAKRLNFPPSTEEEHRDFSRLYCQVEIRALEGLKKDNPEKVFSDAGELTDCIDEYHAAYTRKTRETADGQKSKEEDLI